MKIVVIGEGQIEGIVYNCVFIDLVWYYGFYLKVCKFYCVKIKGKVEWLFCYICEDFFLVCLFCNFDDLNVQFWYWFDIVVNLRRYVMIFWVVNEVFVEEWFYL